MNSELWFNSHTYGYKKICIDVMSKETILKLILVLIVLTLFSFYHTESYKNEDASIIIGNDVDKHDTFLTGDSSNSLDPYYGDEESSDNIIIIFSIIIVLAYCYSNRK